MNRGNISIPTVILIIFLLGGLGLSQSGVFDENGSTVKSKYGSAYGEAVEGDLACRVSGCNGELCVPAGVAVSSECVWQPQFECYSAEYTDCVQISETECGWRNSDRLQACLNDSNNSNSDEQSVTNYRECVENGNAIVDTNPRQCRDNGHTFIEQI